MQLKIQRSQRLGGVLAKTVVFCLDVRAEYANDEVSNIARYRLGSEVIYNSRAAQQHLQNAGRKLDRASDLASGMKNQMSGLAGGLYSMALAKMNLSISVASLARGHHIECKDLAELAEAEAAVMQACRNLRDYLCLAATFNGSTILVDFSTPEEETHVAMGERVYSPPVASTTAQLPAPPIIEAEYEDVAGGLQIPPDILAQAQFASTSDFVSELGRTAKRFYEREPTLVWIGAAVLTAVTIAWLSDSMAVTLFFVSLIVPGGLAVLLLRR